MKKLFALLLFISIAGCHHHQVVVEQQPPIIEVQPNPTPVVITTQPNPAPDTGEEDANILSQILANGETETANDTTRAGAKHQDRAVCFGDNFPGTPAELHECVNDAKKCAINLVKVEGIDPKNIRLFTDRQCTKANYEKWSKWALAGALPGDKRWISNSSHGAEDTDANGSVVDVIVTDDMIRKNQWDASTEVTLDFWVACLRTTNANYLVLNDCCHSGGVMKAAFLANNKKVVRSIDPPAVVQARLNAAVTRSNARAALAALSGTVIPACQASELSEESPDFGGAATEGYWIARKSLVVSNAKAGEHVKQMNAWARAHMFTQHAGLIGQNKPIFGE